MRATRSSRLPICGNNGVIGQRSYQVTFTPTCDVFRMPRKRARVRFDVKQGLRRRHRMIVSVDRIEPTEMRCISVDSANALYLAGRGMVPTHNTRLSSEWVRREVEAGRASKVALVSETAADVRDVMVTGDSGIINCSPPWFKPRYISSRRRLDWPNGAYALLFNGTEPDQLRGPQFDLAVVDELCFVAGTLVTTDSGEMPIERVRAGDRVCTRAGMRRVLRAMRTSGASKVYEVTTSDGRSLVGTAGHPVWVSGKGFVPLRMLAPGDRLFSCRQKLKRSSLASSGAGAAGGSMVATTATVAEKCCTERSIESITALFRKGWRYTTSITTKLTTTFPTCRCLRLPTIGAFIARVGLIGEKRKDPHRGGLIGREESRSRLHVLIAGLNSSLITKKRNSARALAGSPVTGLTGVIARRVCAVFAGGSLPRVTDIGRGGFALAHAPHVRRILPGYTSVHDGQSYAWYVERSSSRKIQGLWHAQESADSSTEAVTVKSVVAKNVRRSVYNIEVDEDNEFFANGILVHNCKFRYASDTWDMLQFGLRLGRTPRALVTTTPRPIAVLKEILADKTTVVLRGSTFDNAENLAASFLRNIRRRYDGTRLGRQELYAEILDDTPGALWNRALLEAAFVVKAPPMRRIVVGVDPAVTSEEGANENGIVVCGKGEDDMFYTLADVSCHGSPDQWARAAIRAYDHWKADRIVAEVNNGGEMVGQLLRTVAADMAGSRQRSTAALSYRAVHARRSKYLRAEPIAAVYEQGRAKHVGAFPVLEDQMCAYVPGQYDGSPDHLDAHVWAMTDLMQMGDPFEWYLNGKIFRADAA